MSVRIIKTEPVKWSSLSFLQPDNFKDLAAAAKQKLKASIIANEFTQPFYVWSDTETNTIFCLDGKHRSIALTELAQEGNNIPDELPCTFIECANRQEAAKLVLQFSSMYAKVSEEGFTNFIDLFDLQLAPLSAVINLPDIVLMEMPPSESITNPFNDEGINPKTQYGVIVMCESELLQQKAFEELTASGYNCKVVVT